MIHFVKDKQEYTAPDHKKITFFRKEEPKPKKKGKEVYSPLFSKPNKNPAFFSNFELNSL